MVWQKGQSGNPSGRPKNHLSFADALRKRFSATRWRGKDKELSALIAKLEATLARLKAKE